MEREPNLFTSRNKGGLADKVMLAFGESQRQAAKAHEAYQKAMSDAHQVYLRSSEESLRHITRLFSECFPEAPLVKSASLSEAKRSPASFPSFQAVSEPLMTADIDQELKAPARYESQKKEEGMRSNSATRSDVLLPAKGLASSASVFEKEDGSVPIEPGFGQSAETPAAKATGLVPEDQAAESSDENAQDLDSEILKLSEENKDQIVANSAEGLADSNEFSSAEKSDEMLRPEGLVSVRQNHESGEKTAERLLQIVAEETGYPLRMLNLSMNLEEDLGIDPIRQVGIAAALNAEVGEARGSQFMGGGPEGPKTLQGLLDWWQAKKAPREAMDLSDVEVQKRQGYAESPTNTGKLQASPVHPPEAVEKKGGDHPPPASPEDSGEIASFKDPGPEGSDRFFEFSGGVCTRQEMSSDRKLSAEPRRYIISQIEKAASGLLTLNLWTELSIQPVYVTNCGTGFARALVELMQEKGIRSELVSQIPEKASRVIYAGALDSRGGLLSRSLDCFHVVQRFARACVGDGGFFVAVQDHRIGSDAADFDDPAEVKTGLSALLRTLKLELEGSLVRLIDLDRRGLSIRGQAERVFYEILMGGAEPEVSLSRGALRLVPRLVAAPLSEQAPIESPVANDGLILVSGGGHGITAAICRSLAKLRPRSFVLLGETRLEAEPEFCHDCVGEEELHRAFATYMEGEGKSMTPARISSLVAKLLVAREIRKHISLLESEGSKVHYLEVNLCDPEAIRRVLKSLRQEWGPVRTLIHGAGIPEDRLIVNKTDEQFKRVFGTKVEGLRHLLSALSYEPLSLICLFSSVAAGFGNRGQSDYAMANEVLNHLAIGESVRRGSACRVLSLMWGPWSKEMVDQTMVERFSAEGVSLLSVEEGCRLFLRELMLGSKGDVCPILTEELPALAGGPAHGKVLVGSSVRAEVFVDKHSHPYLSSHAIRGKVVVPMVLVNEWFQRIVSQHFPGFPAKEVRDLRVFKGLFIESYEGQGNRFLLEAVCQQLDEAGAGLLCTVRNQAGQLCYTAKVMLARHAGGLASIPPFEDLSGEMWEQTQEPGYGNLLFHGPDFQVIRSLSSLDKIGGVALLRGVQDMSWQKESWQTDPAIFDGGLQLAVLWTERVLGGASLPTEIGRVRSLAKAPAQGLVRCVLKGKSFRDQSAVSDVYFLDKENSLIGVIEGIETHLRPDRIPVS